MRTGIFAVILLMATGLLSACSPFSAGQIASVESTHTSPQQRFSLVTREQWKEYCARNDHDPQWCTSDMTWFVDITNRLVWREPTPDEITRWTAHLDAGGTFKDIENTLMASVEYERKWAIHSLVHDLYYSIHGRHGSYDEFVRDYAVAMPMLEAGRSREEIVATIEPNVRAGRPFFIDELHWNIALGQLGNVVTCVKIEEPAEPAEHAWQDNYLCSWRNLGLRYSNACPIDGMHCTQLLGPSDPHTWQDNYLCSPKDAGLSWSFAGPIPGQKCISMNEPSDPDTWADNYLCQAP